MEFQNAITTLLKDGFILVFNQDKLDIVKTAEALMKAGINNMEVTCRIKQPLQKLQRLRKELPGFVAGAASLIDSSAMRATYNIQYPDDHLPSVQQVVDAGACYLVSAMNFTAATYNKFAGSMPLIPGCGTVSEIVHQFGSGANFVKIFPAKQLGGPAFAKAIDPAIHKIISLVPTGGTNPTNFGDYIGAGLLVLGGSFSMIDKTSMQKIVADQDYALLTAELTKAKQLIDQLRAERWPTIDFSAASAQQISQETGRNFNLNFSPR